MNADISKRVCCTCLCKDRKLFQLCRVPEGVNLIYMLLMCDPDAYKVGFYKETASWMVCWECCAIVKKIMRFRSQTCKALKLLKEYTEGRLNETDLQPLSRLSTYHTKTTYETDMFVDCSSPYKLKNELTEEKIHKEEFYKTEMNINENDTVKVKKKSKFYKLTVMHTTELNEVLDKQRQQLNEFKCESCVIDFKDEVDLNLHELEQHTKKEKHTPCSICSSYLQDDEIDTHTSAHYHSYVCALCNNTVYSMENIVRHLDEVHGKTVGKKKRKMLKQTNSVKYPCSECDMTFGNKGAKWKHVQKCHRTGHQCDVCQKVFTFKHNLQRHQLSHTNDHPRSECPHCHKSVRTSLLSTHLRTHGPRAGLVCEPCGKNFVCRETYESHLKYASAHASQDSLSRHPCNSCKKKFRSRGELRDHIAYRHEARPTYKCPVCDKMLATRRCVTRHVRRTHEGVQERARDKMCDYCGQAFRDKQSLSEHVARHTGERPLSCGHCGRSFRQRAALHAHVRRHPRV